MSLFRPRTAQPAASESRYSFSQWAQDVMKFGGHTYGLGNPLQTTWGNNPVEAIGNSFAGYASGAFAGDGVVFAVELKRLSIFSEARFQFQRVANGRPGDLFGGQGLTLLERPWPGGTTGDLLARCILDADLAGNAYWARVDAELVRLQPDWVDIALEPRMAPVGSGGEMRQVGWRKVGYLYFQGGDRQGKPAVFLADEVAHFAPIPDPLATYRGMSWLTPVIREIQADKGATEHGIQFVERGGTPNMVITLPRETTKQQFELFKESYAEQHSGSAQDSYKPLFLTAGADATVVGANMQQLDMKALRGLGETRIAMAGGIHPVVLGSSEGMAGSSLNAGNYTAAKRATADATFRPLWRNVAGSFEVLVQPPTLPGGGPPARLWYDDRDVAFLREDVLDLAEIAAKDAQIIRQLGDGGWDMESIKAAMKAGYDWNLLIPTGLVPVQLQPPGTTTTPAATPA